MAERWRRLAAARSATLATVRPDGAPHLVPLCFAVDGDEICTAVDAKPKRSRSLQRLANIAAEPRVSVLVDAYAEDWTRLWWVRADGDARIVDEHGERARTLAVLADKYAQYRAQPPEGPALRIRVRRLAAWSAS